jgi:hypothetical protein
MTFSAPAYCSQCNRTYRFMDTMSPLCPRCSEARERLSSSNETKTGAATPSAPGRRYRLRRRARGSKFHRSRRLTSTALAKRRSRWRVGFESRRFALVRGKLVDLARRLVDLDREAADVRDEMRRLLSNAGGPDLRPPTRRAVKPAKASPAKPAAAPETSAARVSPNAARIAQARMAEQRILELLADGPKGPAQLARSTNAQISTIGERLRRLKAQGLVARGDQGWTLPIST